MKIPYTMRRLSVMILTITISAVLFGEENYEPETVADSVNRKDRNLRDLCDQVHSTKSKVEYLKAKKSETSDFQKLDSTISDYSKRYYSYNGKNLNISEVYVNKSDTYREIEEYTFDSLDNLTELIVSEWDYTDSVWVLYYKAQMNYDGNFIISAYGDEWYDSVLDYREMIIYTYDERQRLIMEIDSYWDFDSLRWEDDYKQTYNYDSFSNVTSDTSYTWNFDSAGWECRTLHEYGFDPENLLIESIEMRWKNNQWSNSDKLTYDYDNAGELTIYNQFYWDPSYSKWSQNFKEIHVYDSKNRPKTTTTSIPDEDVWDQELFRTDGTAAGTEMIKDILPGPTGSYPSEFITYNGAVYFTAWDGVHGIEFMRTDGSPEGTVLLKDINPHGSSSPRNPIIINNTLYFVADNGTNGAELWKSNGTEEGTGMVKDIYPGEARSIPISFTGIAGMSFSHMNNELYFYADDSVHGIELWKSDGTEDGTVLVKDIKQGSASSTTSFLYFMPVINDEIYFTASNGTHGTELWKSDGTAPGTVMVKDIMEGAGSSNPKDLINVGGVLFFEASDGINGKELWKSDGTPEGTMMVKDINPGPASTNLFAFADLDSILCFAADDGVNGAELWRSDGTTQGTELVKDINPGSSSSSPQEFVKMNGLLYFRANYSGLWKTDGTSDGTQLVVEKNPSSLTVFNGSLYFAAAYVLYKSDGTPEGTIKITPDVDYDYQPFVGLENHIYFRGINRNHFRDYERITYSYNYTCPDDHVFLPYFHSYATDRIVDITAASTFVQRREAWSEEWTSSLVSKYFSETVGLNVSKDTINFFTADSKSDSFEIYSNADWLVTSNQAWLSLSVGSSLLEDSIVGSGDLPITLTAEANPTTESRTAMITVSGTSFDSKTIYVIQNGININDAPRFTGGGNITVPEDAGPQVFEQWVTEISAGAPDESDQQLSFKVTNDNMDLFSLQPTIDSDGTLSFTAHLDKYGTASVSIILADDGGTALGGVDTSDSYTFTITVDPVNDPPVVLTHLNNLILESGFGTEHIYIGALFWDPEDNVLTLSAANSNDAVITVTVIPDSIFISESGPGISTITITANDGEYSVNEVFTVTVEKASGLDEINDKEFFDLNMYPNPSVGIVTLKVSLLDQVELDLEIFNSAGIQVYKRHLNNLPPRQPVSINLEYLPDGIYYIKLNSGGEYIIRKIIVNKH